MAADPQLPTTTTPARRRGCGKPVLVLLLLVLIAAGIFALYSWITLSYSYSDGERVGYVQKFSHKGWLCKTWEGELQIVSMPGSMPQIFAFSVRDEAVAERINKALGSRVALHYEEHRGVPTSCFGETGHFVTDVRVVGQ
ncbi:MAG TPA: hypothetical protein VEL74_15110 [Thermoanaerobaculia bacterium]|nr:hypothetical protein [Thermoanaerobaculia bacterium]